MNTADEAKLCSPICSPFEALVGDMWLGTVVETNRVLSVDLCWLEVLQFSVHLIDLLSTLLRCNGFAGIQKAVMDQMGSRPPNTDHNFFFSFDASLALGSALVLLLGPPTELVITGCHIKSTFCHIS